MISEIVELFRTARIAQILCCKNILTLAAAYIELYSTHLPWKYYSEYKENS